jgi:acetoin utilization protein AcuB
MRIADILTPTPITVGLDDSLAHLKQIFDSHAFHHLLVVTDGELFGIISDRDLLRTISPFVGGQSERPMDAATLKRHAHQIMTRQPITATPDEPIEEAAQRMLEKRISCLPVVDPDGKLLGIVTWRDMLRGLCGLHRSK